MWTAFLALHVLRGELGQCLWLRLQSHCAGGFFQILHQRLGEEPLLVLHQRSSAFVEQVRFRGLVGGLLLATELGGALGRRQ